MRQKRVSRVFVFYVLLCLSIPFKGFSSDTIEIKIRGTTDSLLFRLDPYVKQFWIKVREQVATKAPDLLFALSLGCGALRRALLFVDKMPSDLDIYLDLPHLDLGPDPAKAAHRYLLAHGIDLEALAQAVFKTTVKVDLFVRDKNAFSQKSAYFGKYGEFKHRDVSLNFVHTDLLLQELWGSPMTIKTLQDRRIYYEAHPRTTPVANLESPLKGSYTRYKTGALPVGVRMVQLFSEIQFSKNPNRFSWSEETERMLLLLPLYFESFSAQAMEAFPLDDRTINSIAKMFSWPEQTQAFEVAEWIARELPAVATVLRRLGVNLEVWHAIRGNQDETLRDRLVVEMFLGHIRFAPVRKSGIRPTCLQSLLKSVPRLDYTQF